MPDNPYHVAPFPPPPVTEIPPAPTPTVPGPAQPDTPPTLDNLIATNVTGYGCVVKYVFESGLACSPLAAPLGSQLLAFWREHAGACTKIISAVVTAVGGNPPMPSPITGSDNDVLIGWTLALFTPSNLIDGIQAKGAVLVLAFALQQAPVLGVDVFDMGASPFDITDASDNVLNPLDFYEYLDKASPVTGFSGGPITF